MRSSVLCAVFCTILTTGFAAQGLTRVAPNQEPLDIFAREFRREDWRAALEERDLDQREQHFGALLARARLDPVARAFVEELARDPAGGELAWTARLALRELGRARFQVAPPLFGADPLGMTGRMDEMLQQFLSGGQPGQLGRNPRLPGLGRESLGGRRVHVQQSEQGAKVELIEEVDGKEERRTFEGASLQEILAANPELERDLGGLSLRLSPGQSIDFGLGLPGGARARAGAQSDGRTFATPIAPKSKAPILTDKLGVIVQALTDAQVAELGLVDGQGLYVERSQPGSYADLLGVGAGDVLLELDGTTLKSPDDIERAMKARKAEADLTLVWLDGKGVRQQETWKAR